jgi:hypothetical protein
MSRTKPELFIANSAILVPHPQTVKRRSLLHSDS